MFSIHIQGIFHRDITIVILKDPIDSVKSKERIATFASES